MPNPAQHSSGLSLSHVKKKRTKSSKAKALKSHELDSSPKSKYRRLRQLVCALVYENGALCDETARAQRLVLRAQEERRLLLQKLIQLEQQSEAAAGTAAPLAAGATSSAVRSTPLSAAGRPTTATVRPTAAAAVRTAPAGGSVRTAPAGGSVRTVPAGGSVRTAPAAGSVRTAPVPPPVAAKGSVVRPPGVAGSAVAAVGAVVSAGVLRPPAAAAAPRVPSVRVPPPVAVTVPPGRPTAAPLTALVATPISATVAPPIPVGPRPVVPCASSPALSAQPVRSQWRPAAGLPSPRPASSGTVSRRGGRPARRLVSAAPRDASGAVRLPLRLGCLALERPGRLLADRPCYHSATALYPAGYVSLRRYISVTSPRSRLCVYRCAIEDGGVRPCFSIVATELDPAACGDGGDAATHWSGGEAGDSAASASTSVAQFVSPNIDECHRQLLQRLSGALGRPLPAACRVSGEAFFGLRHPSVQLLLQSLSGAALCGRYKPVLFEVTDGAVVAPSEREPGLSAAALWERLREEPE